MARNVGISTRLALALRNLDAANKEARVKITCFRLDMAELGDTINQLGKSVAQYHGNMSRINVERLRRRVLRLSRIVDI